MAISLDGFIASPDGSVHWLEPYDPYEVGFGEFLASAGTIVMGRKSYDQMLTFGPWPYAGKRTIVMTRRPLAPATPDTWLRPKPSPRSPTGSPPKRPAETSGSSAAARSPAPFWQPGVSAPLNCAWFRS